MEDEYKGLNFGSYCTIEQKRYGCDNEFFQYKVIGVGKANYYRTVPCDARDSDKKMGDIVPIVKAICCGVDESKVETFRICDVKPWRPQSYPKDWHGYSAGNGVAEQ